MDWRQVQNAANVKKQCKATYIISLIYSASQVFQWPTCHSKFRLSGIVRKLTNSVMTLMPAFHPFSSLLYRFSSLILSTRLALPESLSFSTWMMMVPAFPSSLDPPLWRLGTRIKRYTVKSLIHNTYNTHPCYADVRCLLVLWLLAGLGTGLGDA